MLTIPTLAQLYQNELANLQSQLQVTIPVFGKAYLQGQAAVNAGKLYLYYLAIANLQKNIFPDTAEPEAIGGTLERFGRVKLNRNPFAAVAGQYTCTVTGTATAVIPAGTTFKSDDTSTAPGYLFVLDAAFTFIGTSGTITLRALTAGTDSRLQAADTLSATSPIALVNKTATVTAVAVQPLAAEDIEDYRAKILDAFRLEPQGGSAADYRLWSADAQGVARVYPYAKSGAPNEINLFVEATVADSTDGKGTPGSAILTDVEAVVEFDPDTTKPITERGRRPLGVHQIHFLPITPLTVTVNITGFAGLTAAIQTAVQQAIVDKVNTIRPFVSAADILANKNDILSSNLIIQTILNTQPGSVFGAITITVGGAPAPTYTFTNGDIPYITTANVTFV